MRRIGIFGGSFNPIHVGHALIASYIVESGAIDTLWLMVSPQNPLKENSGLESDYDRLRMTELVSRRIENVTTSAFEFDLPKPSYTIDTLVHLNEKFPDHKFSLIMGSDNLAGIEKWKNADVLLRDYNFYVYPRPGYNVNESYKNVEIVEAPLMEISSTFIRSSIKEHKNIQPMLPQKVWEYLDGSNLYG